MTEEEYMALSPEIRQEPDRYLEKEDLPPMIFEDLDTVPERERSLQEDGEMGPHTNTGREDP